MAIQCEPNFQGCGGILPKTILVVDDNQEFLELIDLLLKNAGYDVVLADSAFKAMDILEENIPDAMILDIMMPVRNGLEFLENLRWEPRYENVPIVVLTAMTLTDEEREFVDAFSVAYLDKGQTTKVVDCLKKILPED